MADAGSAVGGVEDDGGWWDGAYWELGIDVAILVVFAGAVVFH
jgi:hypothetical protein